MGSRANETAIRLAAARAVRTVSCSLRRRMATYFPTDGTNCAIGDSWVDAAIPGCAFLWNHSRCMGLQLAKTKPNLPRSHDPAGTTWLLPTPIHQRTFPSLVDENERANALEWLLAA